MSSIHRIRLQGPWEVCCDEASSGDNAPIAIQVPVCWRDLFGEEKKRVRFIRTFNTPTNLDPRDRLFIVVPEQAGELHRLQLNATRQVADAASPLRFEVTASLKDFNRLEIELDVDPAALPEGRGGLWQPVVLEIQSDATDE